MMHIGLCPGRVSYVNLSKNCCIKVLEYVVNVKTHQLARGIQGPWGAHLVLAVWAARKFDGNILTTRSNWRVENYQVDKCA